jgi:hypothetical protein
MRHVTGDAVLLLRDHACDDVHVPSLIETLRCVGFSDGKPPAAPWCERRNHHVAPAASSPST